jgi:putative ABC transport system substrate-binding protein
MPLYLYSYLFPKIHRVGVLYSQRYNQQWFNTAMLQAQEVGISLYGQAIDKPEEINRALKILLPKVDAIWLISDPIVLYDKRSMQTIFAKAAARKKPIFAYNTLFMKYGAVLTIAADIPTMGRQAAGIAEDIINQEQVDKKVQPPAGSHVILNLKKVHEYGIKINNAALSSVEEIIQE